ncbi:MAG: hypothetical protein K2X48_03575 [Chitinophagaceae bacterium]|nr:hypothetical protein [Chitinophagaceae bacterium]
MSKFGVLSAFVLISALTAGLYGILHNQITYTISSDYFSAFKFKQFRIYPHQLGSTRMAVGIIGFLASWWMGIFIGLILGAMALLLKTHQQMKVVLRNVLMLVLLITISSGITGFLLSKLHWIQFEIPWGVTDELINKEAFLNVAAIHNFSYLGGVIGLMAGIVYLVLVGSKQKNKPTGTTL